MLLLICGRKFEIGNCGGECGNTRTGWESGQPLDTPILLSYPAPLYWDLCIDHLFPTSREHRNVVNLCTTPRTPHNKTPEQNNGFWTIDCIPSFAFPYSSTFRISNTPHFIHVPPKKSSYLTSVAKNRLPRPASLQHTSPSG